MKDRSLHVNKSMRQKQDYWRYIESQDYEPTVDEKLPFPETGQPGEELGASTASSRRRPTKLSRRLADHLSENWTNWVFAAVALVLVWLMTDAKVSIAAIQSTMESVREKIVTMTSEIDSAISSNHQQDLSIMENRVRLEFLEKSLEKSKAP
jgi:hypothetical protein